MIKLGEGYYDEASIIAITPSINPRASDSPVDRYTVHTVNGHFFRWDADAAEVQRRLEEVGLIDAEHGKDKEQIFTQEEEAALRDAFDKGYLFVGKDKTGQVYAYSDRPVKWCSEWARKFGDEGVLRISGEFDALSFEDEEPLDLEALFGGEDEN